jgi:hypothetical protein
MPTPNPLSDGAIRDILISRASHAEMGRRYGRSHQAIVQIRYGQTHAGRCPDLPRWIYRSCEQCQHWTGRCGFGFPDPLDEGVGFAMDCDLFLEVAG